MLLRDEYNTSAIRRSCGSHARRGNSIVLVSAILVLLVIVATAFVSRTQAGRTTAIATRQSEQQEDAVGVLAKSIGHEIALNLFAQPIDPVGLNTDLVPNSNVARLDPSTWNRARGGVDRDAHGNAQLAAGILNNIPDGLPDFPYNFAPDHTVPFTNWPDDATIDVDGYNPPANLLPFGPGSPNSTPPSSNAPFAGEGNPVGNPGMGDSRYQRSPEPIRIDTDNDGHPDMFSHYRHLTNLSRADNGWRIVHDIANVVGGGVVENLTIPVEQWLAITPGALQANGSSVLPSFADFFTQWNDWFGVTDGLNGYLNLYTNNAVGPNGLPTNYYRLSDLDGNGTPHDFYIGGIPQDRPESEFIPGTARHTLSRVLADTDGDGFTDAFWHLAPTPVVDGIRHVVAVSIVDNSGMLNANVATRFRHLNAGGPVKTLGITPADLALVSGLTDPANATNVGFYDAPPHQFPQAYNTLEWAARHKPTVGLPSSVITQADRFDYWRRAGLNPLTADNIDTLASATAKVYRPFTLGDEIELRMYASNNHPWIYSSYEQSVQEQGAAAFLRAGLGFEESNELLDQLSNNPGSTAIGISPLIQDPRHRITLYSATRNELLPMWLRYRFDRGVTPLYPMAFLADYNAAPSANARQQALINFNLQNQQKVDLRERDTTSLTRPLGQFYLRDRLPYSLFTAFTDGMTPTMGGGYYNSDAASSNVEEQKLAAGMTANILEVRDTDSESLLLNAVPLPEFGQLGAAATFSTERYLGMEAQPFLVEAFIAHVYGSDTVSSLYTAATSYANETSNVVHEEDYLGTVVVVQLANPFDEPIDLINYRLTIFGQPVRLQGVMEPDLPNNPSTATVFATEAGLFNDWEDFLDLDPLIDLAGDIVLDVSAFVDTNRRNLYDTSNAESVELLRYDGSLGVDHYVVVDRFDTEALPDGDRAFGDEVNRMGNSPFEMKPDVADPPLNGGVGTYDPNGIVDLGDTYDSWVQWVRVTRAWGVDVDGLLDGGSYIYDNNERSPRFVFADRTVVTSAESENPGTSRLENAAQYREMIGDQLVYGAAYVDGPPDDDSTGESLWFKRAYYPIVDADGVLDGNVNELYRKPTFFSLNTMDPGLANVVGMPDKGWYGQLDGGDLGSVDTPTRPSPAPKGWFRHDFSMQMLQKEADFLQIGEVANVWLKGHEIESDGVTTYGGTTRTFAEHMTESLNAIDAAFPTGFIADDIVHRRREARARVNRLQGGKVIGHAEFTGTIDADYNLNTNHMVPDLPAGVRALGLFVMDGPGLNGVPGRDDLRMANGFTGQPVYGMLNLNTASPEVLRATPQGYRMLMEFTNAAAPLADSPRVLLPEAITQYREGFSGDTGLAYGYRNGPDYSSRNNERGGFFGNWLNDTDSPDGSSSALFDVRGDRGLASIGEVLLVDKPATGVFTDWNGINIGSQQWQMSFASNDLSPDLASANLPFGTDYFGSIQLSTDLNLIDSDNDGNKDDFDLTGGDVEEANLLFSGMSNMVTTHSDTFTVYFKVRSFRQNPVTGVWDATDPEYIIEDARYVMLVDRSRMNNPDDQPRILYLEKLPN